MHAVHKFLTFMCDFHHVKFNDGRSQVIFIRILKNNKIFILR